MAWILENAIWSAWASLYDPINHVHQCLHAPSLMIPSIMDIKVCMNQPLWSHQLRTSRSPWASPYDPINHGWSAWAIPYKPINHVSKTFYYTYAWSSKILFCQNIFILCSCYYYDFTGHVSEYVSAITSCHFMTCHYGAKCQINNGLAECICDRSCPSDETPITVCGTDGQTYGSQCQLQLFSCRLQKHIDVAYKSRCQG